MKSYFTYFQYGINLDNQSCKTQNTTTRYNFSLYNSQFPRLSKEKWIRIQRSRTHHVTFTKNTHINLQWKHHIQKKKNLTLLSGLNVIKHLNRLKSYKLKSFLNCSSQRGNESQNKKYRLFMKWWKWEECTLKRDVAKGIIRDRFIILTAFIFKQPSMTINAALVARS